MGMQMGMRSATTVAVFTVCGALLASCGGGDGGGNRSSGEVLFEVPAPPVPVTCERQSDRGVHQYQCFRTLTGQILGYNPPTPTRLSGWLISGLFYDRPSANMLTYREESYIDAGHANEAPSGTAVFVSAVNAVHHLSSDTVTETRSRGSYDSRAEATPLPASNNERQVIEYRRHRDGSRWIPWSAQVLMASYSIEVPVRVDLTHVDIEFVGYDGSNPLYRGRITVCDSRMEAGPGGELVQSRDFGVAVQEIAPDGTETTLPMYIGRCPYSESDFTALVPKVLPSDLRLDWRTGQLR
jgi:hypothetical protein